MTAQPHIILRKIIIIILLTLCAAGIPIQNIFASDSVIDTSTGDTVSSSSFLNEISEGFDLSLRILSYGSYQGVSESTQNPGNDFLRLPRFIGDLEIRPDLFLRFRRMDLSAKPRMYIEQSFWEDGTMEGEKDREDEWYINEWLFKLGVTDSLFLSYGRENIQWGPSYLFSPSNPFFEDNGRMNPRMEVPGMDFARIIWVPSISWAVSFIANTDEGHKEFEPGMFYKSYALKIDYTGNEEYTGLILSHREKEGDRLGAFGGWTATDALLLYADIGFSQGRDILYPVEDIMSSFEASMLAVDKDSSGWNSTVMTGVSYTFMTGPTISVEYLYNEAGYSNEQAKRYYQLRYDAWNAYDEEGPIGGISSMVLGQTVNPGMKFIRKNYIVLQYRQNDIRDVLSLSFSWIYNADDRGGRLISSLDYDVGDHAQIFFIGSLNTGATDTEFRSALDSSLMLGLEYTF